MEFCFKLKHFHCTRTTHNRTESTVFFLNFVHWRISIALHMLRYLYVMCVRLRVAIVCRCHFNQFIPKKLIAPRFAGFCLSYFMHVYRAPRPDLIVLFCTFKKSQRFICLLTAYHIRIPFYSNKIRQYAYGISEFSVNKRWTFVFASIRYRWILRAIHIRTIEDFTLHPNYTVENSKEIIMCSVWTDETRKN